MLAVKAREEILQSEKMAFQLAILKGDFVSSAVVKRAFAQRINAAKSRSLSGVARLAALIRLGPDETTAAEVAAANMVDLWQAMEKSEWFQSRPSQKNPSARQNTRISVAMTGAARGRVLVLNPYTIEERPRAGDVRIKVSRHAHLAN